MAYGNLRERFKPVTVLFLALFCAACGTAWAQDCARLVRDLKEPQGNFPKGYREEAKGLYAPPAFCAYTPLNLIVETRGRTEVQYVEQCAKTGYKALRTTVYCAAMREGEREQAALRVSCEMEGQSLAPCLRKDLEKFFSEQP